MKKKLGMIFLGITILCCTGCNPETGTMTCTMSTYPTDGITLRSTYIAEYKNNVVKRLKTVEQVIAEDEDNLEVYEEKIKELYQDYQGIDHYTNKTKIKDNTLTSTTIIDYSKVDTDKLIKVDSGNSGIIKNGKVNIEDLEKLYKQNGCNCKKED